MKVSLVPSHTGLYRVMYMYMYMYRPSNSKHLQVGQLCMPGANFNGHFVEMYCQLSNAVCTASWKQHMKNCHNFAQNGNAQCSYYVHVHTKQFYSKHPIVQTPGIGSLTIVTPIMPFSFLSVWVLSCTSKASETV